MELYIYDRGMNRLGLVEKIDTLIWTRKYWSCGQFKMLVPFSREHVNLLKIGNLLMKRGDNEAGEIRYLIIRKNKQGKEEIEVQGRFVTGWIGKRKLINKIVQTTPAPAILTKIVNDNVINPSNTLRKIPDLFHAPVTVSRPNMEYASVEHSNALEECELVAKASKLGFRIYTDEREKKHWFEIYDGLDLTAGQTVNPPCIFSQEFDNVLEQDFTNSVENMKTTAYVGGENKEGVVRRIVEVGPNFAGHDRYEVFVEAADITQTYKNEQGQDITLTNQQYINLLTQRGLAELEHFCETLSFSSRINTHSKLKYKTDFNLGDRVTCVDKRWGVKIDVRITEIAEIYHRNIEEVEVTFGENLPTLIDTV